MTSAGLDREIADIRSRFLASPREFHAERALAAAADRAVARVWPMDEGPSRWAALAVGGYGRRTLFPGSDLDILFFFPGTAREPAWIDGMLGRLREIPFPAEGDGAVRSDLSVFDPGRAFIYGAWLDARFLAGDAEAARSFTEGLIPDFVDRHRPALLGTLVATRDRHVFAAAGTGDEPDLKDAPGGLADYRWTGWIRRIAPGVGGHGAEDPAVERAAEFIAALRNGLQFVSGTRGNVLAREYRVDVARVMGFESGRRPDTARLIEEYRAAARVIFDDAEDLSRRVASGRRKRR